mgnify:CR=1 FL=1
MASEDSLAEADRELTSDDRADELDPLELLDPLSLESSLLKLDSMLLEDDPELRDFSIEDNRDVEMELSPDADRELNAVAKAELRVDALLSSLLTEPLLDSAELASDCDSEESKEEDSDVDTLPEAAELRTDNTCDDNELSLLLSLANDELDKTPPGPMDDSENDDEPWLEEFSESESESDDDPERDDDPSLVPDEPLEDFDDAVQELQSA